jgi:hypothetical protein
LILRGRPHLPPGLPDSRACAIGIDTLQLLDGGAVDAALLIGDAQPERRFLGDAVL